MKDNQQPSSVYKELPQDNNYLVYEDGRIFSKKTNRFLKGKIDNMGYLVYALAIQDKFSIISNRKLSKMVYAHRLVAELFLENPNDYPYVHHKDENKLNNHYSNLEWVSPKLNSFYHNMVKEKKEIIPKYYEKDLEDEQWIIIPMYPNYSISSFGRIRNNRTNRLLKIDETQSYSRISFPDKKHYYLHRLVYCVFNNDYDLEGFVVDHIDGDKRNNCLTNLQKITQQENCLRQKRFNDYPPGD